MRCLVNLFHLDPVTNGGASRTAWEVSRFLAAHAAAGRVEVIFLVGRRFAPQFAGWIEFPEATVLPCQPEAGLTPLMLALQPDMLISPLFGGAPFDDVRVFGDIPHVVSMPDALALDKPELFTPGEARERRRLYASLRHATLVLTRSAHACSRLQYHLQLPPERIVIVPNGADLPSVEGVPASRVVSPYIFYPAQHWPHKRHGLLGDVMVEIWKSRPEVKLVLTGGGHKAFASQLAARHPRGLGAQAIRDLGWVSEAELVSLYSHAEALLFMSEYEGFGMPLVEAMQLGCPVICAPLTSMPEVAGDGALYVSGKDPKAWAHAFLHTLPEERDRLKAAGYDQAAKFTWQGSRTAWETHLVQAGLKLEAGAGHAARSGVLLSDLAGDLHSWSRMVSEFETAATERLSQLREVTLILENSKNRVQDLKEGHRETVARLKEKIQKLEARAARQEDQMRSVWWAKLARSAGKRWQRLQRWFGRRPAKEGGEI